jgi:hypothetical protein
MNDPHLWPTVRCGYLQVAADDVGDLGGLEAVEVQYVRQV